MKTFSRMAFNFHFTGGTLGLFTGMSLLTLAEVCYWIVNVFLGLVYEKKFL